MKAFDFFCNSHQGQLAGAREAASITANQALSPMPVSLEWPAWCKEEGGGKGYTQ